MFAREKACLFLLVSIAAHHCNTHHGGPLHHPYEEALAQRRDGVVQVSVAGVPRLCCHILYNWKDDSIRHKLIPGRCEPEQICSREVTFSCPPNFADPTSFKSTWKATATTEQVYCCKRHMLPTKLLHCGLTLHRVRTTNARLFCRQMCHWTIWKCVNEKAVFLLKPLLQLKQGTLLNWTLATNTLRVVILLAVQVL